MPGEKIFGVNEVLTAADMTTYFVQQAVIVKTADESVTSSTTMQNDNELLVPVAANTRYWVECFLIYSAHPNFDCKTGYSGPSGSTFDWCGDGLISGETTTVGEVTKSLQGLGSTPGHAGVLESGSPIDMVAMHKGVLTTGGSAGTLTLRWAQLSSGATPTIVRAGSVLIVTRVS